MRAGLLNVTFPLTRFMDASPAGSPASGSQPPLKAFLPDTPASLRMSSPNIVFASPTPFPGFFPTNAVLL